MPGLRQGYFSRVDAVGASDIELSWNIPDPITLDGWMVTILIARMPFMIMATRPAARLSLTRIGPATIPGPRNTCGMFPLVPSPLILCL